MIMENLGTTTVSCPSIFGDFPSLRPSCIVAHNRKQLCRLLTAVQPASSSQPTDDKTSAVSIQMRIVMNSAINLEREMKQRREELYALAGELRAGRTKLEQFEEEVAEYARLIEADLQRADAADKIRTSASELKQSQKTVEEAAKLVDQALAKIENRRGVEQEGSADISGA